MNATASSNENEQDPVNRPSLLRAVTSLSIWPSTSLGMLIFLSMWLALCEGCDDKVVYPSQWVTNSPFPENVVSCTHYFYGLALATAMAILAMIRKPWAITGYAVCNCIAAFALLVYVIVLTAIATHKSNSLGGLARVIPFMALLAWSVYYPIRDKDLRRLGTVLQNWIAFAGMLMLVYSIIFAKALYVGFFVTLAGFLLSMPAAWVLYVRSTRDLIDRKQSITPFQISIRFLLLCMCLLPVLSFYYGCLEYFEQRVPNGQVTPTETVTPGTDKQQP